ncbi:MAG: zf-HC2 domain-containing protein [Thermodesulfobacteriota bacterium]
MKSTGNKPLPGKCLAVFKKISLYLDGELESQSCREIRKHMEECSRCKTCLTMLQRTLEICRHLTPHEVPEHVQKRLHQIVPS